MAFIVLAARLVYKGPESKAVITGLLRGVRYVVRVRQMTEVDASPFSDGISFRIPLEGIHLYVNLYTFLKVFI